MNKTLSESIVNEFSFIQEQIWFRFENEAGIDDFVDTEMAANFIDTLYDINLCDESYDLPICGGSIDVSNQDGELSEDPTIDEVAEVASVTVGISGCDEDNLNFFIAKLQIHRSHLSIPYKLNLNNGTLESTVITEEEIEIEIDIKDLSYYYLKYNIIRISDYDWVGTVISKTKLTSPPEIYYKDNYLYWNCEVTGTITIKMIVVYDLASIKVDKENTDISFGFENERQTECLVLGFYNSEVFEHTVVEPEIEDISTFPDVCPIPQEDSQAISVTFIEEEDTPYCYNMIRESYRCDCSKEIALDRQGKEMSWVVKEERPCPEAITSGRHLMETFIRTIDYVKCYETEEVNSPVFYEEVCCYPKPTDLVLPDCEEVYQRIKGGALLSQETVDLYKSIYGENTKFISVGPDKGLCGDRIIKQNFPQAGCCFDVTALILDENKSATTVGETSSAQIYVERGRRPLYWKVRGDGFFTDSNCTQREITTNNGILTVYTKNSCGSAKIYVTDLCSNLTITLRSTNGQWVKQWDWTWVQSKTDPVYTYTPRPSVPISGTRDSVVWAAGEVVGDLEGQIRTLIKDEYKVEETISTPATIGNLPEKPSGWTICDWGRYQNDLYTNPEDTDFATGNPLADADYGCFVGCEGSTPWPDGCLYECWDCETWLKVIRPYFGNVIVATVLYSTLWKWECV